MKLFALSALMFLASAATAHEVPPMPASPWVAGWMAAPDGVGTPLKPMTIRQIVRTSVGGTHVRLRFSNLLGTEPLNISSVHLALHAGGGAILEGGGHSVLFQGASTVTLAPGASVASDPVPLPVKALAQLAVSLYLPKGASLPTLHGNGAQTAYLLEGKDAASAPVLPAAQVDDSRYFLTDVDIAAPLATNTLVVVGDSVTDGIRSTQDGNARWTDFLVNRLQGMPAAGSVAVANAGIAGNRILNDFGAPYVGPSTLNRFERDVLSKPGLRWVILLQGINDISASELLKTPADQVSAQQIIDGMKVLIERTHAKGAKIWAGTLLPREGAIRPLPHSASMEAKRQAVNQWIRTSGAFDGVIDFDLALRDPAHPSRQLPTLNSGDATHPNDAGYQAMANAIDLDRLLQAPAAFTAFERSIAGHRFSREQAHDPADTVLPVPAEESFVLAANGQYRGRSHLTYPGKIVFQELTIGSLEGTRTIDELKWREGIAIVAGDAAAAREELAESLFLSPQLIATTAASDLAGRPLRIERDAMGRAVSLQVADRTFRYANYRCVEGSCQPQDIEMWRGDFLAAKWTVTSFRLQPAINAEMFKLADGYVDAAPAGALRLSQLARNVFRIDGSASGYHTGVVVGERGIAVFDPSVSVAEAALNRKLIESQFPGIPITHVILSHNHGDHVRGLPAYLGKDVTVLAGDRASLSLQRQFGDAARTVREVKQAYRLDLGGVEVQILPVKSTHAATMLIAHVTGQKILFEGDLFYIPEQGQVPAPFEGAGELWHAIKTHRLPVSTIVGVHGRSGSLEELRAALGKSVKPVGG